VRASATVVATIAAMVAEIQVLIVRRVPSAELR
jgi:hypothetical protein